MPKFKNMDNYYNNFINPTLSLQERVDYQLKSKYNS